MLTEAITNDHILLFTALQISFIPAEYFKNLPVVRHVRLDGNCVKTIDEYTFTGSQLIEYLLLSEMPLTSFHPRSLIHMKNLIMLDVSFTHLDAVPYFNKDGWKPSPLNTYNRYQRKKEQGRVLECTHIMHSY